MGSWKNWQKPPKGGSSHQSQLFQMHLEYLLKNLFLYLCLCWVLVAARGLSLVEASGGSSLGAVHELLVALLLLQCPGSRAHGLSSRAQAWVPHGISPDYGENSCPLHCR